MKFPYKSFRIKPTKAFSKRTLLLRPIIPIGLSYKNKSVNYEALLDSGADFSIIHADVGIYLGIPIKKGAKETFGGIVGKQEYAYFHKVSITVGGHRFTNIPIGFSYDISPHGYGILGHYGFFNLFRVIFDMKKKQIELREKRS